MLQVIGYRIKVKHLILWLLVEEFLRKLQFYSVPESSSFHPFSRRRHTQEREIYTLVFGSLCWFCFAFALLLLCWLDFDSEYSLVSFEEKKITTSITQPITAATTTTTTISIIDKISLWNYETTMDFSSARQLCFSLNQWRDSSWCMSHIIFSIVVTASWSVIYASRNWIRLSWQDLVGGTTY